MSALSPLTTAPQRPTDTAGRYLDDDFPPPNSPSSRRVGPTPPDSRTHSTPTPSILRFDRALFLGALAFALFLLAALAWPSRASEPRDVPPVVVDRVRGVRLVSTPADVRGSRPADGPMCAAELPEPYEGPAPTHLGVLLLEPASPSESAAVERALAKCSRGVPRDVDPFLLLGLLRLESDLGVPREARSILLAAWCSEAAFRPAPRAGDLGQSHGPLQMMSWFPAWCGLYPDGRLDLLVAASCYWSRVEHYLADGKCPGNVVRAESMAANGMRYAPWKCSARSAHWLELQRWAVKP